MKKTIILGFGVLLAACACTRETLPEPFSPRTITLVTGGASDTRTMIQGTTPYWQDSDMLGLTSTTGYDDPVEGPYYWQGVHYWAFFDNYQFTASIPAGQALTASFTGTIDKDYDASEKVWYAYYPYSEVQHPGQQDHIASDHYYDERSDSYMDIVAVYQRIPNEQHATASTFDPAADILLSEGFMIPANVNTIENVRFARMTSVLKLVLTDGINLTDYIPVQSLSELAVSSVTVEKDRYTDDESGLSGLVKLGLESQSIDYLSDLGREEDDLIRIFNEDGQSFGNDGYTTYAVIVPQLMKAGKTLDVRITFSNGYSARKVVTLANSIACHPGVITTLAIPLDEVIVKNTPAHIEFQEPSGYTVDENGVLHLDQFDATVNMVARIYGRNENYYVEDVDESLVSCKLVDVTDPDNPIETDIDCRYDGFSDVSVTFPTDMDGEFRLKVTYGDAVNDPDHLITAVSGKFKVHKAELLPDALKTWSSSWFSKYRVVYEGNAYLKTYAAGTLYGTSSVYPVMPNNTGWEGPFNGAFSYSSTPGSFDAFRFFEKVTQIPNYAFSDCANLTGITLPDGVTLIGNYAFNLCGNLASVTLSADLETIGQYAFKECDALTSIVIPDKVKYIKKGAFSQSGLTSITIPASVVEIQPNDDNGGDGAFRFCNSFAYVIMEGTNPPDIGGAATNSDWYKVFDDEVIIYVPDTAVETYKTAWPALASWIKGVSELATNN